MLSRSRSRPRRRSTRALGLAVALVAAPFAAGPAGPAHAQGLPRDAFAREPKTPMEAWEVASYLIRVGQPAQAAPYVKKFLDANPDDATVLEVRDTYGAGSILRLSDDPATRPYAKPLVDRLARATARLGTDPDRIARAIDALSKSPEERAFGVERLREAGPYAVPAMIRALNVPGQDPAARGPIADSLGKLDRSALPPLIAALDSDDPKLLADAAKALGEIGDPRAIPALTYLSARRPESLGKVPADLAILRLTGRGSGSQPRTPARVLADEARMYHLHQYRFPGDPIVVWLWDPANKVPTPVSSTVRDAEGLLGIRAAREAVELDPTDVPAQALLLGLGLDHAPDDWKDAALSSGPDVLGRVVRSAIADNRPDLAARAVGILGRVVDRDDLRPEDRPSPLIDALMAPDRRIQLAAAEALVKLDPRRRFAGSSRVVPLLARFATSQAAPRALVVDGNAERGGQVAGFLRGLGYDSQVEATGARAFAAATESADVELMVIDPHFVDDPWGLPGLLGSLKADPRTAGIPIFLVGPLELRNQINPGLESFPDVRFLVTPAETTQLKPQIDRGLASLPSKPFTPEERVGSAKKAASLLAEVGRRPGSPFEPDLANAEPALSLALNGPAAGLDAAAALGDVPGVDAQRALADVALDGSKDPALRLASARQLARNVTRFGPKLARDQERRLVELLAREADPALRDALASAVGALKPIPDASGSRLKTYRTSSP